MADPIELAPDNIPRLQLPIRVDRQGFRWVEQDTLAEVETCVAAIVHFPIGFRQEAPDFGVPEYEFEQMPVDLSAIEEAVAAFESRADIEVYQEVDQNGTAQVVIDVAMQGGEEEGVYG